MGTEILRPQDCLIQRIRAPPASLYSRRRNYGYPNPSYSNNNTRPSRRPTVRHEKPDQRRQRAQSEPSMTMSRRSSMSDDSKMMIKRSSFDDMKTVRSCDNNSGLAMEKVMILKRGESLDSMMKKKGPAALEKMTGKCDVYAGSAFSVSPEPSSLPLPSFFKKQISVDDSATRDLKRLLRLEL